MPVGRGHPETMKTGRQWTDVVRASRPLWHGHSFAPLRTGSARARERDAPATAGETPAPRFSKQAESLIGQCEQEVLDRPSLYM